MKTKASFFHITRVAQKKLRRGWLNLRLKLTAADEDQRLAALRRYMGREDLLKLRKADKVFVSVGKSGRTWLRVMVSRLYQQVYRLPEHEVINFDNFHHMDRRAPRIFFTHDDYLKFYSAEGVSKNDYHDKEVVLLVRDPRDVAVSQFFHWAYRMKPRSMALLDYPSPGTEMSIYEFLMGSGQRLPRVIETMNQWAKAMRNLPSICLIRYEDLHSAPFDTLEKVAKILEIPANAEQIQEAVDYAAYDNMKKMESKEVLGGGRIKPRKKNDPNSYKVRRAKVGGYRDYFDDREMKCIDALVEKTLDPVFGYGAP
jgi:alcohol sulfotransferase